MENYNKLKPDLKYPEILLRLQQIYDNKIKSCHTLKLLLSEGYFLQLVNVILCLCPRELQSTNLMNTR